MGLPPEESVRRAQHALLRSTLGSSDIDPVIAWMNRKLAADIQRVAPLIEASRGRSAMIRTEIRQAIDALRVERPGLIDRELTTLVRRRAGAVLGTRPDVRLVREEIKRTHR
jgi:hypothetical protein